VQLAAGGMHDETGPTKTDNCPPQLWVPWNNAKTRASTTLYVTVSTLILMLLRVESVFFMDLGLARVAQRPASITMSSTETVQVRILSRYYITLH